MSIASWFKGLFRQQRSISEAEKDLHQALGDIWRAGADNESTIFYHSPGGLEFFKSISGVSSMPEDRIIPTVDVFVSDFGTHRVECASKMHRVHSATGPGYLKSELILGGHAFTIIGVEAE